MAAAALRFGGGAEMRKSLMTRTQRRRCNRKHTQHCYRAMKDKLVALLRPMPTDAIPASTLEPFRAALFAPCTLNLDSLVPDPEVGYSGDQGAIVLEYLACNINAGDLVSEDVTDPTDTAYTVTDPIDIAGNVTDPIVKGDLVFAVGDIDLNDSASNGSAGHGTYLSACIGGDGACNPNVTDPTDKSYTDTDPIDSAGNFTDLSERAYKVAGLTDRAYIVTDPIVNERSASSGLNNCSGHGTKDNVKYWLDRLMQEELACKKQMAAEARGLYIFSDAFSLEHCSIFKPATCVSNLCADGALSLFLETDSSKHRMKKKLCPRPMTKAHPHRDCFHWTLF